MTSDEGIFTKNLHYPLTTIIPPGPMSPLNIKAQTFHFWLTVQVELWKMRVILLFATFTIFAVDLSYQKPAQFTLPAGIPTGTSSIEQRLAVGTDVRRPHVGDRCFAKFAQSTSSSNGNQHHASMDGRS